VLIPLENTDTTSDAGNVHGPLVRECTITLQRKQTPSLRRVRRYWGFLHPATMAWHEALQRARCSS